MFSHRFLRIHFRIHLHLHRIHHDLLRIHLQTEPCLNPHNDVHTPLSADIKHSPPYPPPPRPPKFPPPPPRPPATHAESSCYSAAAKIPLKQVNISPSYLCCSWTLCSSLLWKALFSLHSCDHSQCDTSGLEKKTIVLATSSLSTMKRKNIFSKHTS